MGSVRSFEDPVGEEGEVGVRCDDFGVVDMRSDARR